MSYELDCRGLNCPAPVLQVRDVVTLHAPALVTVLVDNEAARQNVSRFLEHQDYRVTSEAAAGDFRVVGSRAGDESSAAAHAPVAPVRSSAARKIMVLVTGSHMGHGDDNLGDMLMFNFIKTLKEMGPDLWRIAFVNSGVGFVAGDSEAVPILQELAASGVGISACGACLTYLHLLDALKVGEVTNMLEIVTAMKTAESVITI